jgi:hypothetical protein
VRGVRRTLVESILLGSFRPDRQGHLLLEETLPVECPLEGASDGEQAAWRNLVTAQLAYRDSGAVNPWQFASLVRLFHHACSEPKRDVFLLKWSLSWGPWGSVMRDGVTPAGEPRFAEDELREAWEEWAQYERPAWKTGEWDETTWAHRHFVLGEEPVAAFQRCRELGVAVKEAL